MARRMLVCTVSLAFAAALTACGSTRDAAPPPAEPEPATQPAEGLQEPGDGTIRPEITAEACEQNGGEIIGDIGDGAIHRADYRCPSGAAPTGNIRAPEEGPMGVEGSVCCPR